MHKKNLKYLRLPGFLNSAGFRFFSNGNPSDLSSFSFFSFFACFFTARLSVFIFDERYQEDVKQSLAGSVAYNTKQQYRQYLYCFFVVFCLYKNLC